MWVGENRGGCAIESQERSKKERKRKKKERKKSKARFQIFANNTRNTAYKTRWDTPPALGFVILDSANQ